MLHLANTSCSLDLEILEEANGSGIVYPSVKLEAAVRSNGFCGQSSSWVFMENMERFCKALISLNNTLKGNASLESISPEELSLIIAPVNLRGYLGVSGLIGHHFYSENTDHWHSVNFGFEFEPSQLQLAIQAPWIKKYAG